MLRGNEECATHSMKLRWSPFVLCYSYSVGLQVMFSSQIWNWDAVVKENKCFQIIPDQKHVCYSCTPWYFLRVNFYVLESNKATIFGIFSESVNFMKTIFSQLLHDMFFFYHWQVIKSTKTGALWFKIRYDFGLCINSTLKLSLLLRSCPKSFHGLCSWWSTHFNQSEDK